MKTGPLWPRGHPSPSPTGFAGRRVALRLPLADAARVLGDESDRNKNGLHTDRRHAVVFAKGALGGKGKPVPRIARSKDRRDADKALAHNVARKAWKIFQTVRSFLKVATTPSLRVVAVALVDVPVCCAVQNTAGMVVVVRKLTLLFDLDLTTERRADARVSRCWIHHFIGFGNAQICHRVWCDHRIGDRFGDLFDKMRIFLIVLIENRVFVVELAIELVFVHRKSMAGRVQDLRWHGLKNRW